MIRTRTLCALALLCLLAGALPASRALPAARAASGCTFLTTPGAVPAFCDTFDAPAGTGNRSGDLNGAVWGASRLGQNTNPSQGYFDAWSPAQEDQCGTAVTVQPEADIHICSGRMVEASNDNGLFTDLTMYPTQPFDIAGRTGTVVFDVDADALAAHGAWPSFVFTDQPVPAPYKQAPGLEPLPRNSVGFTLDQTYPNTGCPAGQDGIDTAWVTRNYVQQNLAFTAVDNCFAFSPGVLNHFEVRLSQGQVDIYGTDAGTAALHHLVSIPNANLPLTRGLIWMEDTHYNGNKDGVNQRVHTFNWDNVGFDGPVLPGDVHLDANDALTGPNGDGSVNLGWGAPDPSSGQYLTLKIPGATSAALAAASGALLTLNYWPYQAATLQYRLNGHAWHAQPWPFPDAGTWAWRTVALPVPLSELVAGTNQLDLQVPGGGAVANVDLILLGARPVGTPATATPAPPTSTNTPAPPTATRTPTPAADTATRTATPAPTRAPVSVLDAPCTVQLAPGGPFLPGTCTGSFQE